MKLYRLFTLFSFSVIRMYLMHLQAHSHRPHDPIRTQGNATFTEVGEAAGVADVLADGRGCGLTDLNHDGRIDLIVANGLGHAHRIYLNQAAPGTDLGFLFVNGATTELDSLTVNRDDTEVTVVDFNVDGRIDLIFSGGTNDALWLANIDGKNFRVVVTVEAEHGTLGNALYAAAKRGGGAVVHADFDGDGQIDTYHPRGAGLRDVVSLAGVSAPSSTSSSSPSATQSASPSGSLSVSETTSNSQSVSTSVSPSSTSSPSVSKSPSSSLSVTRSASPSATRSSSPSDSVSMSESTSSTQSVSSSASPSSTSSQSVSKSPSSSPSATRSASPSGSLSVSETTSNSRECLHPASLFFISLIYGCRVFFH